MTGGTPLRATRGYQAIGAKVLQLASEGLFLLVPVWLIWWGIDLLHQPVQID